MAKTPVFVSWSGDRAKSVAVALCDWMRRALQTTDPWCSPELDAGDRWSPAIAKRLSDSKVGIIVVTRENHAAPWLLFEAGALSKSMDNARVIPYFVGLKPTDITGPLTQFQGKVADKDETYDVVKAVNASLDEPNSEGALTDIYEMWWPRLEKVLAELPPEPKGTAPRRKTDEMVEEVLSILRRMEQRQAQSPEVNALIDRLTRPRSTPAESVGHVDGTEPPKGTEPPEFMGVIKRIPPGKS